MLKTDVPGDRWSAFGRNIAKRPWWIIACWLCLLAISLPASHYATRVLHGGGGFVPGSESERVDRIMESEFNSPYLYPVLVIFQSHDHTIKDKPFRLAVGFVEGRLRTMPIIRDTRAYVDVPHWQMTSRDGHTTVALVGLSARTTEEAESIIPELRGSLASLQPDISALDPSMHLFLTSDTAFNVDIDLLSAQDSARAEKRSLPFVLICLIVAFGALVAAGLPLAVGLLSTTITGALVFALGHFMQLSILVENVASMVGLATGIDYALVMVSRFREELGRGREVHDAVAATMATSGKAVATSGAMVAVGMLSMFISPLRDIRSMALGCMLVVFVAVIVTLTFLPALLALLGSSLDAPRWLSRWLRPAGSGSNRWMTWARYVVDHPWRALILGLTVIALLTVPALDMWTGMPEGKWIPRNAESRQGYEALFQMGHAGLSTPITVLIAAAPGHSMITPEHLTALHGYVEKLQHDPRVESVQSLVSVEPSMDLDEYIANYEDPAMLSQGVWKDATTALLSRGRNITLINVVPANGLGNDGLLSLVNTLRSQPSLAPDLTVTVGGYGGWLIDFRHALRTYFLPMVLLVMLLTWGVLFYVFRSWLLPFKAIVMNLMSVGTAFGLLVAVYQWGSLAWLIGLREPPGRVLVAVPPMLFCIVFGLSMDYEVFLVSRIQEFWLQSRDNRTATMQGLASTGPMITSAALIMVAVFGCFALADMVIVSMLGFGLAVAVAIDATLIRIALVPAFMMLAGKYNWLPGHKKE